MRERRRLLGDRRGATAVEYGLILALIGVAISAALSQVSTGLGTTFGVIGTALLR
jgi:pilus assembly protein Flp/PilA